MPKTKNIMLNEIKSMVETFTIKEEKFINQTYSLNLGVSFNKKKVFNFLDSKNIFPTEIKEEKFFNSPVYTDLEQFKKDSDLILCNRNSSELSDVENKIFTRDIFQKD